MPNPDTLGRFDNRLIHQQDRNAVPDGVNPVALTALQALAFMLQDQALLANRADQNFQQLWGDHSEMILLLWREPMLSVVNKLGRDFPNRIVGLNEYSVRQILVSTVSQCRQPGFLLRRGWR
jgi:hypothetical protein